MTPDEIRAEYEGYRAEQARHRGALKVLQARIGVLQEICKHPGRYQYSAMGELGMKCPDCGYQT